MSLIRPHPMIFSAGTYPAKVPWLLFKCRCCQGDTGPIVLFAIGDRILVVYVLFPLRALLPLMIFLICSKDAEPWILQGRDYFHLRRNTYMIIAFMKTFPRLFGIFVTRLAHPSAVFYLTALQILLLFVLLKNTIDFLFTVIYLTLPEPGSLCYIVRG